MFYTIGDANHRTIATCHRPTDRTNEPPIYGSWEEMVANAMRIVACVNAHDGLVKALESIERGDHVKGCREDPRIHDYCDCYEQKREANRR